MAKKKRIGKARSFLNWIKKHPVKSSALLIGLLVVTLISVFAVSSVTSISYTDATKCASKSGFTTNAFLEKPQKGSCVRVAGKVFRTESADGKTVWQVFTDPENSQGNVIVVIQGSSTIKNDDYVEATGVVKGEFEGENAFGATLKLPVILAGKAQKVDRSTALGDSKTVAQIDQTQDQQGVQITLEKVEYTDTETRAYVKIKNSSNQKINFYSFNAKFVQNGSQVKEKPVYDDKESAIPSDIVANTEESGIVYFEVAKSNQAASLTLEAVTTSDYSQLLFTFDIPVV